MAMLDYGLLIKVLGRTTSAHDAEILVAIKKANEMLAKAGLQWRQVIVMLHNSGEAFERDFNTDALHRAAQAARASRFGDDLRKRQAERDKAYAQNEGQFYDGMWSEKGPGDDWPRAYTKAEPEVDAIDVEDDARVMTESITGEAAQTNWFVFAMVEPRIARWLFDKRESHAFHRILFAQVCEHGELGDNQIQVVQRMMMQGR